MAQGCSELAARLSQRLEECGVKDKKTSRLIRTKRVFKCMWNKREIDEINARLEYFRSQLALQKIHRIQQIQGKSYAAQASRHDIQDVRTSVEGLGPKLDANTAEILRSIAEVKVENSQLHARAIQEAPSGSRSEASLHHLVKTILDEYEERMAANVEKRFRAAFAAEFDDIRKSLPQSFAETQPQEMTQEMAQDIDDPLCSQYVSRGGNIYTKPVFTPDNFQQSSRQDHTRAREGGTLLYSSWWIKTSRLGDFHLRVTRSIIFDEHGLPTSIYDLFLLLLPSPCWFTTGCSITYQSFTDRRGRPKIVLQPEIFRILDRDHDVWRAILEEDNMSLRDMLDMRLVSPSDRNVNGNTFLHVIDMPLRNMGLKANIRQVAAGRANINACKMLIHYGADVNVKNRYLDADIILNLKFTEDILVWGSLPLPRHACLITIIVHTRAPYSIT